MTTNISNEIKGSVLNGVETRLKISSYHYDRPVGSYSVTCEAYASCLDCGDDWKAEHSDNCYDLSKMGESTQAAIDACLEELQPKIEAHKH